MTKFNDLIIYEDDLLLVFNKPAGVVVNKAQSLKEPTIQDWLNESYFNITLTEDTEIDDSEFIEDIPMEMSNEDSFLNRSGIVHRLDKETSGVLLIAKTDMAFKALQTQFAERRVKKEYMALVFGRVKEFDNFKELVIDAPIARNPRSREKFAVVESGRASVTNIYLREYINSEQGEFTLLSCKPLTGRTHQIRVHLTALGYPVAGDKLYSGRTHIKNFSSIFPRQMLHAEKISFVHPGTGLEVEYSSPIPKDISIALESLK
jgi:23S rRNA pseudouridine1911/1915/1917 synthase